MYYFEIRDVATVERKFHERAESLPALLSGCSGIDVQKVERRVRHHLEDVGVTAYHQLDALIGKHMFQPWGVTAGVATDMSEKHIDAFNSENEHLRTRTRHIAMIHIAAHSSHLGANPLESLK